MPRWPPEHSLELLKGREEEETEDERDKRETRERRRRRRCAAEGKRNQYFLHPHSTCIFGERNEEKRQREMENWRKTLSDRFWDWLGVYGERKETKRKEKREKRRREKRRRERLGEEGGGITSFGETTFFLGWGGQRRGFRFWLLAFGFWIWRLWDFGTLRLCAAGERDRERREKRGVGWREREREREEREREEGIGLSWGPGQNKEKGLLRTSATKH